MSELRIPLHAETKEELSMDSLSKLSKFSIENCNGGTLAAVGITCTAVQLCSGCAIYYKNRSAVISYIKKQTIERLRNV
jgi:hypothetical protein